MGDQRTRGIANRLNRKDTGFISETARSFIKRHADPTVLLGQLKSLYQRGEHSSCADLVQLICEEMHPLSTSSELFVLRAKIALEDEVGYQPAAIWLRQASLNNPNCPKTLDFENFLRAQKLLADGLYDQGRAQLEKLLENETVGMFARFLLGYHLLLKTSAVENAIYLLEGALELKPNFKMGWEALGFAYNKNGQKNKAQEAFAHCISLETNPEKLNFYKQQLAS